ncbi:MAG TPA: HAD-IIA family hydrolase, partial [Actinomycetota bacterium]|nr:HAD-IIA family hydrolase [Actinomycetota bacterium]
FRRFVVDLDGVVWSGTSPIPGSCETIRALRDAGCRFAFVTNNSSERPEVFAAKLESMGAGGDPSEVVTSAMATGKLLETAFEDVRGRTAFVVGGPGLVEAVRAAGVHPIEGDAALDVSMVVVGLDVGLTYEKLRIATLAIRRGARFVAANVDPTLPAEEGQRPGAGAIVAALQATTGVTPLVAGKPEPYILQIAQEKLDGGPALVVGDRISTDVIAAKALGWPSALVLTGATTLAELAAAPVWPDAILRRMSDLLEDLPHPRVRPASGPDLPVVATLLHEGGLQAGNVRERSGRTVVAENGRDTLIATAAWDPAGESVALVRSVAVSPGCRGKTAGILAVAGALRLAARAGMREAYLATVDAEGFFTRCGFATVDRDVVPESVLAHPQISRECPTSAAVMKLTIPDMSS